jgi:deazaflavin-dependent oxidoreductase (nitroreductase family)
MDPHMLVKLSRTPLAGILRNFQTFLFRSSGGVIGNKTFGCDTFLLTTTGAKSGRPRTAPLLYIREGENYIIVASNAGSPKHPAWWINPQKNPQATIQIGREVTKVRARKANAEEKARLWPRLTKFYDVYAVYQSVTKREIPVAILEPGG